MSSTSTGRSGAISARPVRVAVVVPGKFDVFARAPQRRLKMVVLPVFGFPIRTMRGEAEVESRGTGEVEPFCSCGCAGRLVATAGAATSDPLVPDRDHEDPVRDRAG